MKQEEDKFTGLPENAFRELKPGEVYNPLMSPKKTYPEVNLWSVAWGIAMAILFSAAAAYLGLKVGQVFEAAIPIAIIAVGVSGAAKRKNALGENVIIQSIGACSGVIVAGAIFTLPALYILQAKYPDMSVTFMQVFISSLLGGVLGILFLIPFRKYFVSDMHGKYPFPEATATTQVLVSGEKGGSQAKPLLMAGLIGGLYDFIVATFGWWNENFTTRVCGVGEMLADKAKLVFKVNTGAAVLGLGYIVGLKYASIICFGSLAVWWIIVPGMTLMTLILASVVMVAVGLKGPSGMVASLVMGGVVCTALSMAGGFITDLKIGYWLGSTPAKQEAWKFLGTIVSAATVGGVMIILNKTYGFTSGQLAAPQANAMAAVIEPLMSGVGAPWMLYGIGAVLAIVLTLLKVPALAFALGMFIPLELNIPLVVGGAINWYVTTRSKDASLNTERGEKGTLLASGFIAGGALMGVVSAAMRFGGINLVNDAWLNNTLSQLAALIAYALLILYFIKASMKVK